MDVRGFQNYKRNAIESMTPNELLLVLYDELVKRLLRSGVALDNKDWPLLEESTQRCIDILNYLDDTLNHQYPISRNLHQLYDFFIYELQRVKIGRNKEELEKIKPMIIDLRDCFREADKKAPERAETV